MTSSTVTNFGATKDGFLTLSTPPNKVYPEWALTPDQVVNFTVNTITRTELSAGSRLYRVWGGPAGQRGAYWSPDKPEETTEGEWRSRNAVEPWWNAGTKLAVLTVKDGASINVWSGGITSQPALYANGERIPDYFLVGGGQQCLVPFWLPDISSAIKIETVPGGIPWEPVEPDETYRVTPDVQPSVSINTLDFSDPVQQVAIFLYEGGTAMRALAKALDAAHQTRPEAAGGPADMAADNMITLANAIVRNVATNPKEAIEIARRAAGLRRVVDIDTGMLEGDDARIARQADAQVTVIAERAGRLVQDA